MLINRACAADLGSHMMRGPCDAMATQVRKTAKPARLPAPQLQIESIDVLSEFLLFLSCSWVARES